MQTLRSFLSLCLLTALGLSLSTPASAADEGALKVGEFTKARIVGTQGHDLVAQPF